ncbi:hypothetical protein [Acinetobacter sp. CFCC 10889]|uniref:hypothetical protein n=1 Tax=Acinetobacter sp. CFCC 10889 TaxID=1775557 RepID=UPI000DCFC979|nr:hypothetical protein [Acinetobacter sp. CFCC 10889]
MQKYILSCILLMCNSVQANSNHVFAALPSSVQLSSECTQDDPDVFEPKTYRLNVGKVTLTTYSCRTEKTDHSKYYSSYGLKLSSGKQLFLNDQAADAIGYVGGSVAQVDASTVVFDNMYERGGDLVLVWFVDEQHVYSAKIPYMASDEGSVTVTARGQNIILQKKIYLGDDQKGQAQHKNVGQALVVKKEKNKGLIYQSGNVKNFQQDAFK